tara:strand:- start:82 stop:507 length:426 start_codon:yes stop_codon:yes gene_type:complete
MDNSTHNNHPEVEFLFWNFFPFDMFVWGYLKYILNNVFWWAYPFFEPFALAWNFIPDTSIFIVWLAVTLVIFTSGLICLFDLIMMTILEYFYFTALPNEFWEFIIIVLGLIAVGVIYGLTGGSYDFNKLATGAWLTTTTTS